MTSRRGIAGFGLFAMMVTVTLGFGCDASWPLPWQDGTGGATTVTVSNQSDAGTTPTPSAAQLQQETMARWNQIAAQTPTRFDFHWAFQQFPHPTFKGGSSEAYADFAAVLLAFFRAGDNFDFLLRYHLQHLHLVYVLGSGQTLDTDFTALATFFAGDGGTYAQLDTATRASFADYAGRLGGAS